MATGSPRSGADRQTLVRELRAEFLEGGFVADSGHTRQRVSSGTVWEQRVGYSRAVRVGNHVYVSGTTATTREGGFVGVDDAYAQTRQIIANIQWALQQAGATLEEIVRYRVYLVRQDDWPAVGRALSEALGTTRPANTLVGITWLVDPRMLIEIDVDAVIGSGDTGDV